MGQATLQTRFVNPMRRQTADRHGRLRRLDGVTGRIEDIDADALDRRVPERRAARATLALWRRSAADGALPRLSDMGLHSDGDAWRHRFLLVVDPNPVRSVFIVCGAAARAAFHEAVIGRALEDVPPPGGEPLLEGCAIAARDRVPVEVEGAMEGHDRRPARYRAIFLPLGGESGAADYLMGTFGCRLQGGGQD